MTNTTVLSSEPVSSELDELVSVPDGGLAGELAGLVVGGGTGGGVGVVGGGGGVGADPQLLGQVPSMASLTDAHVQVAPFWQAKLQG